MSANSDEVSKSLSRVMSSESLVSLTKESKVREDDGDDTPFKPSLSSDVSASVAHAVAGQRTHPSETSTDGDADGDNSMGGSSANDRLNRSKHEMRTTTAGARRHPDPLRINGEQARAVQRVDYQLGPEAKGPLSFYRVAINQGPTFADRRVHTPLGSPRPSIGGPSHRGHHRSHTTALISGPCSHSPSSLPALSSAASSRSSSRASSSDGISMAAPAGMMGMGLAVPPPLQVEDEFETNEEYHYVAQKLKRIMELRRAFLFTPPREKTQYDIFDTPIYSPPKEEPIPPCEEKYGFRLSDEGVFVAWQGESEETGKIFHVPSRAEFAVALKEVMEFAGDGPAKTFCHNRLHILEARFNLHELLNHELEHKAQKSVPHRDFYNVRKVDNHVHHSACMNQKHLLRFIKHKLKQDKGDTVIVRDGKPLTLTEVFESLNLTPYDLNVDTLDMHADKTFHRFDKFNLKYNPVGESRLREIFLKYNNHINGKFLAEITRQVLDDLESNKYQFAEYRVSIYGRKASEWDELAAWIVDNKLWSNNVRWMIQIPRLFGAYKKAGLINNFQEMIDNIFRPLFEVTVDPSSHPKLHIMLQSIVGLDSVDDESVREKAFHHASPLPKHYVSNNDPNYCYFAYYLYASLTSLNKLRAAKGFNTIAYRPHAGEAGDVEHLAGTYLLAHSINHGLMLQKSPTLQYLYYLSQVGLSMSPLSNNLLFLEYDKNPFPRFFQRGLNVALSTDDPLMIHVTKEPLMEEYSVAAQVWKLTPIDMCEIARNSVLQSGFEHRFKAHWIGNNYWHRSTQGNDIRQTNLPDIRVEFRWELLSDELSLLSRHAGEELSHDLIDPR